ncbi:MAG: hypothetical protein N4A53_13705 [Pelagimonas sp.]|jgi:hypothetical protein|nr:hypothetical protein [Pelagimonas sp.]
MSIAAWLTDTFSNREIASGVWVLVSFFGVLCIGSARQIIPDLLKAALHWRLIILFGSFALWVSGMAWLYGQIGLWSDEQVFATIIWTVLNGFALLGRSLNAAEDDHYFKKLIKDNFRLTGAFEFVFVAFSFSLIAELFLVPTLAFLGLLAAVAGAEEKTKSVKIFLEYLIAAFVIYVIYLSVRQIFDAPEQFFTASTGRNMILPILFSIGAVPLIYIWFCASHIQKAKIGIDQKTFQSDELKAYARRRFFLVFCARPWLLKRAVRQFHVLPAKERADVDRIIHVILSHEREAEAPPAVDPSDGWSPYVAREFLADFGLRTDDFHDSGYDDEWWAGAPYVDLDNELLPNKATFYIEGREGVVERLKLTGKFNDEFPSQAALDRLNQLAGGLVSVALGLTHEEAFSMLEDQDEFTERVDSTTIKRWSKRYPSGTGFEVFVTLSRGRMVE